MKNAKMNIRLTSCSSLRRECCYNPSDGVNRILVKQLGIERTTEGGGVKAAVSCTNMLPACPSKNDGDGSKEREREKRRSHDVGPFLYAHIIPTNPAAAVPAPPARRAQGKPGPG